MGTRARRWVVFAMACGLALGCDEGPAMDPDAGGPSACADAFILGYADEITVEALPFAWTFRDGWWVGDEITVQVPPDVTGLTLAVAEGEAWTGVTRVVNNGEVLIDTEANDPDLEALVPPFFHVPVPGGAVTFPMSPDSAIRPGCLTVTAASLDDLSGTNSDLYFVSRRRPAGGLIGINAIVVGETDVTVSEIQAAFATVDDVFMEGGAPRLATVEMQALPWPEIYVAEEGAEVNAIRSQRFGEDEGRLNVFFVQDFLEVGTLGFAAGIPGPNGIHGTVASGLVISIDTHLNADGTELDAVLMGETIAHEIGHQLGLFHTSEADGLGHDALVDTAECGAENDGDADGEVAAEECLSSGGTNLMFWTSGDGLRQRTLSASQTHVLSLAPVAR